MVEFLKFQKSQTLISIWAAEIYLNFHTVFHASWNFNNDFPCFVISARLKARNPGYAPLQWAFQAVAVVAMKNNKLTTTMMMTSSMMPILYQSSAGAKLYILLKVGTNFNQLGKLDFLGTYIVHTTRYYCFEIVLWVMESSTLNMQMIIPRKTFSASIKR